PPGLARRLRLGPPRPPPGPLRRRPGLVLRRLRAPVGRGRPLPPRRAPRRPDASGPTGNHADPPGGRCRVTVPRTDAGRPSRRPRRALAGRRRRPHRPAPGGLAAPHRRTADPPRPPAP